MKKRATSLTATASLLAFVVTLFGMVYSMSVSSLNTWPTVYVISTWIVAVTVTAVIAAYLVCRAIYAKWFALPNATVVVMPLSAQEKKEEASAFVDSFLANNK